MTNTIKKLEAHASALRDLADTSLSPMHRIACALKANRLVNELNARPIDHSKETVTQEDRDLLKELGVEA